MTNTVLITLMISLTAMVSLGAVVYAFLSPALANKERASRRIKSITEGEQVAAITGSSDAQKAKDRRKDIQDKMKELEQKKKGTKERVTLRNRIDRAGLDVQPLSYYIFSLVLGAIFALTVWASGQTMVTVGATFFVATVGLPLWFLSFLAARRQKAFTNELANAVDIIVRGVKSGLPINECLQIIANESPDPRWNRVPRSGRQHACWHAYGASPATLL